MELAESDNADTLFTLAVNAFRRNTSWPSRPFRGPSRSSPATRRPTSSGRRHRSNWAASPRPWPIAQTALDLDDRDRDPDTYRIRAEAYLGLQQYGPAKDNLDRVLRESRHDADAYCLRQAALDGLGRPEAAVADLSKAIVMDPYLARAYRQRSQVYGRLGRRTEAAADHETACRLDPDADS